MSILCPKAFTNWQLIFQHGFDRRPRPRRSLHISLGSSPKHKEQTEKSDDAQRWRCPGGEWVYALDIGAEA